MSENALNYFTLKWVFVLKLKILEISLKIIPLGWLPWNTDLILKCSMDITVHLYHQLEPVGIKSTVSGNISFEAYFKK